MAVKKMSEAERQFVAWHRAAQAIDRLSDMRNHMDLPTVDDGFGVQEEMRRVAADLKQRAEALRP